MVQHFLLWGDIVAKSWQHIYAGGAASGAFVKLYSITAVCTDYKKNYVIRIHINFHNTNWICKDLLRYIKEREIFECI